MTPETFKIIRLAAGLSVRQLATVLRIQDAGTIRRYENGSREVSGPVSALMDMIHKGDLPERFNPVAPG